MNTRRKAVNLRPKADNNDERKGNVKKTNPKTVWKQLTIRIPADLHRSMKIRVIEDGRGEGMGKLIEKLVREYLAAEAKEEGKK